MLSQVKGSNSQSTSDPGRGNSGGRLRPSFPSGWSVAMRTAEDRMGQLEHYHPEVSKIRVVGLTADPDDQIDSALGRPYLTTPDLGQPPPQTITGHRSGLEPWNDQSHPRVARCVVRPDEVQPLQPAALTRLEAATPIGSAGEAAGPGASLAARQRLPCFLPTWTVSFLRPFFRRRDSVARPHRSSIRARKPCFAMRRLFRGRYDGFIVHNPLK